MQNDVMTDKFIDYVNDRIEDLDMTKSSLARSVGLDKNSVTKYLKKERTMPLHVALKIANYLNMDISREDVEHLFLHIKMVLTMKKTLVKK